MASIISRKLAAIAAAVSIAAASHAALAADEALSLSDFGVFSSGGTVTAPVEGKYNAKKNWQDITRAGTTAHVDHAGVLYAIPAKSNGIPVVMLHGYGQSRTAARPAPPSR